LCRHVSRGGLRWTRQRRHVMLRAGRIALREPEASCGRTALRVRLANIFPATSTARENPVAPTNARTAKPCGPGRRCHGQALAEAAVASTGAVSANFAGVREARRNSAPGRARHKPSTHCAGKAVCWASPVCRCAFLLRYKRTADRGCRPAPGLPCALLVQEGGVTKQSSGELSRESGSVCPGFKCELEGRCCYLAPRISSAAKQSRILPQRDSGLLRRISAKLLGNSVASSS